MDKKNLCYLLGGVVVGGTLGVLATIVLLKKKFLKELDRRVDEMEAYYKRTDEYDKRKRDVRIRKDESKEEVDICKPTDCKEGDQKNYAKAYRDLVEDNYVVKEGKLKLASDEELLAEQEYPEEDPEELDEEEQAMFESHLKERGRDPRIISFEKMGELDPSYDNQTLFYYMYDETVTDEDGNVIDEPNLLLGKTLGKYGFADNQEKTIYVQNFQLRTVYEVVKEWKTFEY